MGLWDEMSFTLSACLLRDFSVGLWDEISFTLSACLLRDFSVGLWDEISFTLSTCLLYIPFAGITGLMKIKNSIQIKRHD